METFVDNSQHGLLKAFYCSQSLSDHHEKTTLGLYLEHTLQVHFGTCFYNEQWIVGFGPQKKNRYIGNAKVTFITLCSPSKGHIATAGNKLTKIVTISLIFQQNNQMKWKNS